MKPRIAPVAQVEELAPVAQLDRATGFEPVGRGFESLQVCMKNGKCPKCESKEIYHGEKRRSNGISVMNVSQFTQAWLDNYTCTQCGYVESYIIDSEIFEKIRKKWNKVE
jgi:predicted nucleic-acid-binding Zn-ribbon protein